MPAPVSEIFWAQQCAIRKGNRFRLFGNRPDPRIRAFFGALYAIPSTGPEISEDGRFAMIYRIENGICPEIGCAMRAEALFFPIAP